MTSLTVHDLMDLTKALEKAVQSGTYSGPELVQVNHTLNRLRAFIVASFPGSAAPPTGPTDDNNGIIIGPRDDS